MSSLYFPNGKVNIRAIKHDIAGTLFPFEASIKCIKDGDVETGLNLQRQVLEKLRKIAAELAEDPERMSKPTAEGG